MSTLVQTGFKLAQAVISNGAVTGNPWSNPDNLLLVDGDVSESNPNNAASDIVLGNFNPNVPEGATVLGIEVKLFAYRGAQTSPPLTLSPNALDNTTGEDLYYPYTTPFSGLTQSLAEYILGNSVYLFDTTWTVDQINNFKLQLVANGDIYVDAALINVHYSIPDSPTPPAPGDNCPDCNSPIQAQPFRLALPFLATDTKCYLQSFNYPDGTPIEFADLGACGGGVDFVFDKGVPKTPSGNFEENAFCGIWTVLENGTVELDFGSLANRGLQFHTPYEHVDNLLSDHDAGSEVIISNSGHFYDRFRRKCSEPQPVDSEIVAGDTNTFTLAHVPITGRLHLYGLGPRLYPTTDYTIAGAVITTVSSWPAGSLLADYYY